MCMKKLLILLLCAASGIVAVSARDTEVSVSYGVEPAMGHLGVYRNDWSGMNCWGAINATIDHRFAPNLWIGLSYTYSSADSDHASKDRYGEVTWHGLMANVRYEWYARGGLLLYSHVGVGALVEYFSPSWEDSYNRTNMAFQVSPIGVQYDFGKHVGVFAEAGYGVQGVVKAGVRIGL